MTFATTLTFFSTPIFIKLAWRLDVVDKPNESHKTQEVAVPYFGGLAIAFGILTVSIIGVLYRFSDKNFLFLSFSILGPALVLGIVGLFDDIRKLSPKSRFIVQTLAGIFTGWALIVTDTSGSSFGIQWLDFLLTILWVVGITNAVNFLDNLDGAVSGSIGISTATLALLSLLGGQILISALSLVICGSCLGFLYWNRFPARIYMGDAGALFLGTLLAGLLIRFDPASNSQIIALFIPICIVAIPIMDTTLVVLSRMSCGKSPFQGGRDHLSHRLMMKSIDKNRVAINLWCLTAFFCVVSVIMSFSILEIQYVVLFSTSIVFVGFFRFFWKMPYE